MPQALRSHRPLRAAHSRGTVIAMDVRFLLGVALVAALGVIAGLAGVDPLLAHWLRASGGENARVFVVGLAVLDTLSGMRLWIWAIGWAVILAGAITLSRQPASRLGRTLVTAGLVQFATLLTMIAGKGYFGRLRPFEALALPDGSPLWFVGGGSFPSGHASFYFGLLLPLAATCSSRWLRAALTAIAVAAVVARVGLAKHFLSDISAGALVASLYALLAAMLSRSWLPAPRATPAR
jgi:membrane-associated phospholipid phosphatase